MLRRPTSSSNWGLWSLGYSMSKLEAHQEVATVAVGWNSCGDISHQVWETNLLDSLHKTKHVHWQKYVNVPKKTHWETTQPMESVFWFLGWLKINNYFAGYSLNIVKINVMFQKNSEILFVCLFFPLLRDPKPAGLEISAQRVYC